VVGRMGGWMGEWVDGLVKGVSELKDGLQQSFVGLMGWWMNARLDGYMYN